MVKRVASREPLCVAKNEGSSTSSSSAVIVLGKKRLLVSSLEQRRSNDDKCQQQQQQQPTTTTASVCDNDDDDDDELQMTGKGLEGGSKMKVGEIVAMDESLLQSASSTSLICASLRPSPVTVATTTMPDASDSTNTTTASTTTAAVTQTDAETTAKPQSNEGNKITATTNDLRCGLVVEAASRHVDRRLHPERPARIQAIVEALERRQLRQRCAVVVLENNDAENGENSDDSAVAAFLSDDDYLRVHLPGYLTRLDKISVGGCCRASCAGCDNNNHYNNKSTRINTGDCQQQLQQQLQERCDAEAGQYDSIFLTPHSLHEAKRAAAALCRLTAEAVTDRLDAGFAVIRPPGHHAQPGLAGGYCLLNNVALAAAYARSQFSSLVDKILIVDYDVHLGHGTQSIFLDDPNVLYFSVHRYGGNFYPFTTATSSTTTVADGGGGGCDTVGRGAGRGSTVNIGWSCSGMGDAEYVAVWQRLLLPMAREFDPDLVLVSAGFDAADGDLGECRVTPHGFAELTRLLQQCLHRTAHDGNNSRRARARPAPVVCALEGGYVRSTLGDCVAAVVEQLLVDPSSSNKGDDDDDDSTSSMISLNDIHPTAARNIKQTMEAQRPYWSCLSDAAAVEK